MTIEEIRGRGVPEGYRLVKTIDHWDEKGPILRLFSHIRPQEEDDKQNAKTQRVLDEIHTAHCLRWARGDP